MSEAEFAIHPLRRCPLFANVDEETLAVCAGSLRVRRYRKGETIFHQGDPGDSLYILESGSVKIVLPSPDTGDDAIIATLTRGDFFGELALLDGAPHSATAVAMEPTEARVLARERFDELAHSRDSIVYLIRDRNVESLFHRHNDFHDIQRISTEILLNPRVKSQLCLLNTQLFDENVENRLRIFFR